jgi:DNA polymerase elongation subunit (family B)
MLNITLKDVLLCIWQVIYGDTDSIMIYSGLDDIAKAKTIAGKVIQEVNFVFELGTSRILA